MTEEHNPVLDITQEALQAMLHRALRNTLILGVISALVALIGAGWRSGAMLVTGTAISAASILEWAHLVRLFNARLDKKKTPASSFARRRFLCAEAHHLCGGHLC